MKVFVDGFVRGGRETPCACFAPAVALWRLLVGLGKVQKLAAEPMRSVGLD